MAYGGMEEMMGEKNSATKKHAATVSAVMPVRPPSLMPAADSMYTVRGGMPSMEPRMMDMPSTQ